jgi:hypothetical protein
MLDGALEVLNDAAFELAGGPLVVDDCDLELDAATAREMAASIAAARRLGAVDGRAGKGG